MKKKELIEILNKVPENVDIYIHVAYNTYAIRQIVNWHEFIVLNAGEVVNPEDYEYDDDFTA